MLHNPIKTECKAEQMYKLPAFEDKHRSLSIIKDKKMRVRGNSLEFLLLKTDFPEWSGCVNQTPRLFSRGVRPLAICNWKKEEKLIDTAFLCVK